MTTINLKRYYPYMTENVMLEVSDEIAAALSMGGRLCDSYKRQKRRNGECSLDTDPGFEVNVVKHSPGYLHAPDLLTRKLGQHSEQVSCLRIITLYFPTLLYRHQ